AAGMIIKLGVSIRCPIEKVCHKLLPSEG
uniref:Uncharacterized protein n=1 Tax=Solanum lycopersicum TaxID=4081 RepID=K4CKK6_SOLLC